MLLAEDHLRAPAPAPNCTFWELVDWRARASGSRTMLLDEFGRTLTFGEFRDAALALSADLAEQGVRARTVVAWQLPNTFEAAILMAALSRLGAVQCPMVPIWGERELTFMLDETGAELLLTMGSWRGRDYATAGIRASAAAGCRHTTVEVPDKDESGGRSVESKPLTGLDEAPDAAPRDGANDTSWILYTSGTSSAPKGVRHSDASAMASAVHLLTGLGYRTEDVDLLISPITHVNGLMTLTSQLVVGSRLVVLSKFDPIATVDLARRHGVSVLRGPAPVIQAFVDAQLAAGDERLFPRLRACQTGGSPRTDLLNAQVQDVLGLPGASSAYGMTECPGVTACSPYDDPAVFAETVGRPIPGCEVIVVDDRDRECPAGEVGEVLVRGPQLFAGYADASLDAAAFDDRGFYRSGDLGLKSTAGYLTITGRSKDIIIRKGENISPAEVENVLAQHRSISEVAVVGIPDAVAGERCCAVIVTRAGESALTVADLREACEAAGLARHKWPEEVRHVQELPRNAMGKVVKSTLLTLH